MGQSFGEGLKIRKHCCSDPLTIWITTLFPIFGVLIEVYMSFSKFLFWSPIKYYLWILYNLYLSLNELDIFYGHSFQTKTVV